MPEILVIAHDIRSTYNIGSIFRICEGLGVKKLILSGYSPYPDKSGDKRLPHIANRASKAIAKTALGAEKYLSWEHVEDILDVISNLRSDGYLIVSLEQAPNSIDLNDFKPPNKLALILGSETQGIDSSILKKSDSIIEIRMQGRKESFNVSTAAAMCLYSLSAAK